jgi:hypothetical protein
MCGLPQAGKLAADQLEKFLAPCGFIPAGRTPGLWKHKTRDILFTLIVGDFGARCTNRADVDHLISALNKGWPFLSHKKFHFTNCFWLCCRDKMKIVSPVMVVTSWVVPAVCRLKSEKRPELSQPQEFDGTVGYPLLASTIDLEWIDSSG